MAVMHTVIMTDTEYRYSMRTLDKMQRDSVFAEDAKKLEKIFRRDMPVPMQQEGSVPTAHIATEGLSR